MAISALSLPVPAWGTGVAVDVSSLIGDKTISLSGQFVGFFTVMASHDLNPNHFVPIAFFDADYTEGVQVICRGAYRYARVDSKAEAITAMSASISGLDDPGVNLFGTIASIPIGSYGNQAIVDLATLFPPTGLEQEITINCTGSFGGSISVEGSQDGINFNPLGSFSLGTISQDVPFPAPHYVLSPLLSKDKVRYVRAVVNAKIYDTVTITIGGGIPTSSAPSSGLILPFGDDRETQAIETEVIIFEANMDFAKIAGVGVNLIPFLTGIGINEDNIMAGTVRLYVGATAPGDTAGGTVRLQIPISTNVETKIGTTGLAFANPGGQQLVQITLQSDSAGKATAFRGYQGGFSQ